MIEYRDKSLKNGVTFNIDGKTYKPKYDHTVYGFMELSGNHMNTGLFVVPDKALENAKVNVTTLLANYNTNSDEEYAKLDKTFEKINLPDNMSIVTKTYIYDSSRGVGAIVTFIGLYLGIIFLISSAAILALKELSESSDNKDRYAVLRKIGADEKMINRSLFKQIGIFFLVPLLLAIVHSIFGIKCANIMLSAFGREGMIPSIIMTAAFVVVIYGGYFLVTYFSSKRIIKEQER